MPASAGLTGGLDACCHNDRVTDSPTSPARRGPRSGGSPTLYTVAELAGVSHQTVSRYLRGATLRPANRERVEQALIALDYQVNDIARALATNRPALVGALMPAVDDWAPQRVLGGAVEAARAAGYLLDMLRVDPDDPESVDQAMGLMNRRSIAGVVVLSPSDAVLAGLDLGRLRVPYAVEHEPEPGPGDPDHLAENHPSALAVEHLVDLGHRRFFHVGGPATWATARNRRQAYLAVLKHHELASCGETETEWGAAGGYAAMDDYPGYPVDEAPTAIVAASDQLALGVLRWLAERGIRVPQDVSVTGYDGIPDAAFYTPALTTVEVDFAEIGRHTVRRLISETVAGERPDVRGGPAARLVRRSSTAAPGTTATSRR